MEHDDQADIELEECSGNVFADLGFKDAGELFARATLGFHVYRLLKDKKLKQKEIADRHGFWGVEGSMLT